LGRLIEQPMVIRLQTNANSLNFRSTYGTFASLCFRPRHLAFLLLFNRSVAFAARRSPTLAACHLGWRPGQLARSPVHQVRAEVQRLALVSRLRRLAPPPSVACFGALLLRILTNARAASF